MLALAASGVRYQVRSTLLSTDYPTPGARETSTPLKEEPPDEGTPRGKGSPSVCCRLPGPPGPQALCLCTWSFIQRAQWSLLLCPRASWALHHRPGFSSPCWWDTARLCAHQVSFWDVRLSSVTLLPGPELLCRGRRTRAWASVLGESSCLLAVHRGLDSTGFFQKFPWQPHSAPTGSFVTALFAQNT